MIWRERQYVRHGSFARGGQVGCGRVASQHYVQKKFVGAVVARDGAVRYLLRLCFRQGVYVPHKLEQGRQILFRRQNARAAGLHVLRLEQGLHQTEQLALMVHHLGKGGDALAQTQVAQVNAGQIGRGIKVQQLLVADIGLFQIDDPRVLPQGARQLAEAHLHGEILAESDLPHKLFAYTPCFRREAGSHRADERGMVRGHQFNKIEMFQYTLPEKSDEAFEELVGKAERLVKGLGFHFRTVKLAAGDCSASMARTYDIEIQIPSMNGYKEVSSVSNARDYQARRGNIRFRREATGKTEFVHTLNGSGLATSRIFPAMVEQNQRADGSVVVPEVLRKYLGGLEVLEKKNF